MEDKVAAQHRAAHRRLLLGHQDPLAARPRAGRAHGGGQGRARLRHHRQLADLEAHRRARARHRRQQRVAHDAVRHPPQRLGPRAAGRAARARQPAAQGAPVEPRVRRDRGRAVRRPDPDRRRRRRPAERALRPGLLQGRAGQEHLRHRLLHADAPGRAVRDLEQRPRDHRRGTTRRAKPEYALEGSVFVGGAVVQWLRDGLQAISASSEVAGARRERARQRRRGLRARLHRPGRALLGRRRARHHHRPDARQHGRPHRARRAREHRLPERRLAAGHGRRRAGRRRRAGDANCASTAAPASTTC